MDPTILKIQLSYTLIFIALILHPSGQRNGWASNRRGCNPFRGLEGRTAIHHRRQAKCILIHCPAPERFMKREKWSHTHTRMDLASRLNCPHLSVRLRLDWEVLAVSIVAKYEETNISQPAIGNKWPQTISRLLLPSSDRLECWGSRPHPPSLWLSITLHLW